MIAKSEKIIDSKSCYTVIIPFIYFLIFNGTMCNRKVAAW